MNIAAMLIHVASAIAFALLLVFTLADPTTVRELVPHDNLLIVVAVTLAGLNITVRYIVATEREYRADRPPPRQV